MTTQLYTLYAHTASAYGKAEKAHMQYHLMHMCDLDTARHTIWRGPQKHFRRTTTRRPS
jgi:hypothetical protein